MADAPAVLLLPERRRLGGTPAPALARTLARARPVAGGAPGEQSQLRRWFDAGPGAWPVAALQRQAEAGDAGTACWLRADPVHLRADAGGIRLVGWGRLGLSAEEADALIEALAPGFGETGIDIGRTAPEHWFLRLPLDLAPPDAGAAPADALGEDLLAHLPAGDAGRVWRRLQNDAQMVLAQHPVNASRAGRGQAPANSVWFWGAGVRGTVDARVRAGGVVTRDPVLAALGVAAGAVIRASDDGRAGLVDLRTARDWSALEPALLPRLPRHAGDGLVLDFSDGQRLDCRPRPWWRRTP